MTTEANKAILRRYKVDILNSRDIDASLDEVVAPGYVDHAASPGQAPGLRRVEVAGGYTVPGLRSSLDDRRHHSLSATSWSFAGTTQAPTSGIPRHPRQRTRHSR